MIKQPRRICAHCGRRFFGKLPNARLCSHKCQKENQKVMRMVKNGILTTQQIWDYQVNKISPLEVD